MRDFNRKVFWKSLLPLSSCVLFASPLVSCQQIKTEKVENIKIETSINDITINLGEEFKSDYIVAKCYDNQQKIIDDKQPQLQLFLDDGQSPPWININNLNQICIYSQTQSGTWTFCLQACFEDVKSEQVYFKVTIVDPKIVPDEIQIASKDELDMFAPGNDSMNLNIIAYKDGKVSSLCNKSCSWRIKKIESCNKSSKLPTFNLEDSSTCSCLYCETGEGLESIGEFDITIEAKSLVNQDLVCNKTIRIVVTDGESFVDPKTQYCYRRMSTAQGWVLYKIPDNSQSIGNVKSEIQGISVYKIFDNLCYVNPGEEGKIKTLDLPLSITDIGKSAFSNQKNLTKVCMPGVEKVAENAFLGCENMFFSSAKPEPQFKYLYKSAFQNCKKLKLNLDQPTVDIYESALSNTAIEKIYFNMLWHLEDKAFENCTNLTSFTIDRLTPPFLNGDPFKNVNANFKIYVPQSDINDYLTDSGWKKYSSKIVGF